MTRKICNFARPSFRSQRAFTVMEMMVTLGLLAGATLFVARFMNQNSQSAAYFNSKNGQLLLVQEIRSALFSQDQCNALFQNVPLHTDGSDTDITLNLGPSAPAIQAGADLRNYGLHIGRVYLGPAAAGGTTSDGSSVYKANLFLSAATFTAQNAAASAPKSLDFHEIPVGTLNVVVGGGVITACVTGQEQTDLLLQNCTSFGGTYNTTTKTCKLPQVVPNTVCGPNMAVTSIIKNVPYCTNPNPSCAATTTNNCNLPTTPNGGSAGSCPSGWAGSCSYTCNAGSWELGSNSCVNQGTFPIVRGDCGGGWCVSTTSTNLSYICSSHGFSKVVNSSAGYVGNTGGAWCSWTGSGWYCDPSCDSCQVAYTSVTCQ